MMVSGIDHRKRHMLIIPDSVAAELVDFSQVIEAVEGAFRALDDGSGKNFDVVLGHASKPENGFAIKSGVNSAIPRAGFKVGSYFPSLRDRGMPAHSSTIFLLDEETGRPAAAIGANGLNGMRTAAANAAATRLLAREQARILGVVGAGHQAAYEAHAVCLVRPIERIYFWSPTGRRSEQFVKEVTERTGIRPEPSDLAELVMRAEVLVTVTPSRKPLVDRAWIRPGAHISAMGADAVGKQELDPKILARASVYVDSPDQAMAIGECQHAFQLGLIAANSLRTHTLGRLLNGRIEGRKTADEVTLFDSSGMALQDIAVGELVYRRALERADLVTAPLL